MKRFFLSLVSTLLLLSFSLAVSPGQTSDAAEPQYSSVHGNGNESWTREQLAKMHKEQKLARQKQLKEDTTRLLELATELKNSVDKTNENVLSLDVVKKAEEIEKLAKHVKTNMRDEAR